MHFRTSPLARFLALGCIPALTAAACHSSAGGTTSSSTAREAGPSMGGAADAANGRSAASTEQRITIRTGDEWTLVGELIPEPGAPVVILVHQLSSNRSEWEPLVTRLHLGPSPLTTLALDLRGHGESTAGPGGTTVWQSFGSETAAWWGVVTDVASAVRYVRTRVAADAPIALVGSSIGSSAVLRVAADDPRIAGVILLSPGASYRGIDTLEPMAHYAATGRPALLFAADGDRASAQSVTQLTARAAGDPRIESIVFPGLNAHGVSMAADGAHPELWDRADRWLRHLFAPPPPAPHD